MSELERALAALDADRLFPPTPDLAAGVRTRLAQGPTAPPRRGRRERRGGAMRLARARPALASGLALLAVVAAALAASPDARSAVLDLLSLQGARIERGEPTTTNDAAPLLGRRVTPGEAQRLAGFEPALPALPALGAPRRAAFEPNVGPGGQVAFVWEPRPGLTAPRREGRTALVLTELQASLDPAIGKVAGLGTRTEPVVIAGEPGVWLAGRRHEVAYLTPDGATRAGTARLAGDTLLWQRGGLLLRLEGAASKLAALTIARSIP